jgi:large subunit ribosomal protein L10
MGRQLREQMVKELRTKFTGVRDCVVVDFTKLNANQMTELRLDLSSVSAGVKVLKNSTGGLALKEVGVESLGQFIVGPCALAYGGGEPQIVIQKLLAWKEKTKLLDIKGGLFDGQPMKLDALKQIALLPPRKVLLAIALGTIQAPLTQLLGDFNSTIAGVARSVDGLSKKKAEAPKDAPPATDAEPAKDTPPAK